jgi:hypothetical protein
MICLQAVEQSLSFIGDAPFRCGFSMLLFIFRGGQNGIRTCTTGASNRHSTVELFVLVAESRRFELLYQMNEDQA